MPTRVIEVVGVDTCTCCGTHVRSTAQLQAIKFTHVTKMRGNIRLFFVVGNRLMSLFHQLLLNDARLSVLLSCGRGDHVTVVEKAQAQMVAQRKQAKGMMEEYVVLLAGELYRNKEDSTKGTSMG